MLDVSWTASYEITLVRPSVRLSDESDFKIGSLVLSDIVHDDSWPWYLVTNEARFLKKKLAARIWRSKMRFLAILLSLDHTLSLKLQTMISLRQYLTSSTGNICKKIFSGPKFFSRVQNQVFFSFSQICINKFPWYCTGLQLVIMSNI